MTEVQGRSDLQESNCTCASCAIGLGNTYRGHVTGPEGGPNVGHQRAGFALITKDSVTMEVRQNSPPVLTNHSLLQEHIDLRQQMLLSLFLFFFLS